MHAKFQLIWTNSLVRPMGGSYLSISATEVVDTTDGHTNIMSASSWLKSAFPAWKKRKTRKHAETLRNVNCSLFLAPHCLFIMCGGTYEVHLQFSNNWKKLFTPNVHLSLSLSLSLGHTLPGSLPLSLSLSLTHSLTQSLNHAFTRSITRSLSLFYMSHPLPNSVIGPPISRFSTSEQSHCHPDKQGP